MSPRYLAKSFLERPEWLLPRERPVAEFTGVGEQVDWPDQDGRLRAVLGERLLSFNPVLDERESSLW